MRPEIHLCGLRGHPIGSKHMITVITLLYNTVDFTKKGFKQCPICRIWVSRLDRHRKVCSARIEEPPDDSMSVFENPSEDEDESVVQSQSDPTKRAKID